MKLYFITKLLVDSIPSPQTVLVMHDKLTVLPAVVKNSQHFDSLNFLTLLLS